MKRILAIGLATAALLGTHAFAGEVLDRVAKTKQLVVAADTATPPTSFLNEKSELDGFDIEVSRELASRLGAHVRFVTPGWDVITAGHWNGRWDISIASMTPTAERAKVLDFPVTYYSAPAGLAVNKANTGIKDAVDASGKRVGVQGASTYEYYLNGTLKIEAPDVPPIDFKIHNARTVSYDTEGLGLDDLRLGDGVRLDAAVASVQAIDEAIRSGYPIKRVGGALFYEPLAIAIDKGDPAFGEEIKKAVESMRADGTLRKLSEKWFHTDYTAPIEKSK